MSVRLCCLSVIGLCYICAFYSILFRGAVFFRTRCSMVGQYSVDSGCLCVRVVSGLPYPDHVQSSYTKQTGVCPEQFYDRSTEVSAVTCRYLCDTAPRKTPCYGYTHYVITPEDARLGTTVSTCRFLTRNCNATRQEREAFTYVQKHSSSVVSR